MPLFSDCCMKVQVDRANIKKMQTAQQLQENDESPEEELERERKEDKKSVNLYYYLFVILPYIYIASNFFKG